MARRSIRKMKSRAEAVIDFGDDEDLDGDDLDIEDEMMDSGQMGVWRAIRPSMLTALYLKMDKHLLAYYNALLGEILRDVLKWPSLTFQMPQIV